MFVELLWLGPIIGKFAGWRILGGANIFSNAGFRNVTNKVYSVVFICRDFEMCCLVANTILQIKIHLC